MTTLERFAAARDPEDAAMEARDVLSDLTNEGEELDPAQLRRYNDAEGRECPVCQSKLIIVYPSESQIDMIFRDHKCGSCHAAWTEELKVVTVRMTDIPHGMPHPGSILAR